MGLLLGSVVGSGWGLGSWPGLGSFARLGSGSGSRSGSGLVGRWGWSWDGSADLFRLCDTRVVDGRLRRLWRWGVSVSGCRRCWEGVLCPSDIGAMVGEEGGARVFLSLASRDSSALLFWNWMLWVGHGGLADTGGLAWSHLWRVVEVCCCKRLDLMVC